MIGNFLKKLVGKSDKKTSGGVKLAIELRHKSAKFSRFLGTKFQVVIDELNIVKSKCKNLRETNYNLGLKHLEKGNLADAIFRFRFIKKFWPDLFDAHYQLAYCLVLENESKEAKKVLEELLKQKPDYDPKARELLKHINSALQQSSSNV